LPAAGRIGAVQQTSIRASPAKQPGIGRFRFRTAPATVEEQGLLPDIAWIGIAISPNIRRPHRPIFIDKQKKLS
jgi:hypothetical protein